MHIYRCFPAHTCRSLLRLLRHDLCRCSELAIDTLHSVRFFFLLVGFFQQNKMGLLINLERMIAEIMYSLVIFIKTINDLNDKLSRSMQINLQTL